MRPLYDDFADFDLDFADGATATRILREKLRAQRRLAGRHASGPGRKPKRGAFDDEYDDDEGYEDYDEYEGYDDRDDDEPDSYSRNGFD